MIENKNCFFKVSASIIKFALKIVYFRSFLVWKLFFRQNNQKLVSDGSCQFPLVYDTYKCFRNAVFWKHSWTSANLPVRDRWAEWLTDFETPASIKMDPIFNNYLTQTMENNACSGVRRVQAEMSFIFIFSSIVQIEKNCVVFWVLDQHTDYINRSSKRLSNELLWLVE